MGFAPVLRKHLTGHLNQRIKKDLECPLGHTDLLTKYKVFKTEVDTDQIERLPPEIKVHYQDLYTETVQSAKVTLPKELQ